MLRLKHATLVSPAPQMDRLAGVKKAKDTNGGRTLVDLRSKVGGVSPNSKKRTPVGGPDRKSKTKKRDNQGATKRAKTTRASVVAATAAPAARLIQEQSTVSDPALGDSAASGLASDVSQNNIIHGGDGSNWSSGGGGSGLSWVTISLALLGAAALILVAARVRARRSLQQQQQQHSTPSKSSSSSSSSSSSASSPLSSSSSSLFSTDSSYAAGDSQPLLHGKGRDE
jgi:hypothetical protein